ncbi:MAG: ribosome biogenesis GTPase Der [Brevinematia bacterium]
MKLKVVSIVGKPNTGKSSLFNAIVGRGKAIVFDKPGTTIDVNREIVDLNDIKFILQDTGGYLLNSNDSLIPEKLVNRVRELLETAIKISDLIIFTVEYNNVSYLDYELAKILRKYESKVKLVITKVDTLHQETHIVDDVYRLGFDEIIPVSSKTKYGFDRLLESIKTFLTSSSSYTSEKNEVKNEIKIGIVGRINVGKSTIMNAILGNNRVLVDDKPGTTIDNVDDFLEINNKIIRITDTAGFRRSLFKSGLIEKFGIERSKSTIRNSDIIIIVIDGKEGFTKQDKKVLKIVIENFKPFVIAINKFDLVVGKEKLHNQKEIMKYHTAFSDFASRTFEGIEKAPIVLVSGKEKFNIDKLIDECFKTFEKSNKRISTGMLNRKIRESFPNLFGGEVSTKLRIYYLTQVDVNPPTFVIFVNKLENFKKSTENLIKRKLTEIFDFGGVPIKLLVREKTRTKKSKGE